MLVELAIGDAYGAGFEYAPPEFVARHNTLAGYVKNPTHPGLFPGRYTDDTQMSLAICEQLLSGAPWTAQHLADRFVAAYHRDPRAGYSRRIRNALAASHTGAELLATVGAKSDRSGAAMRAGPIGLLPDLTEILRRAEIQARLTHDTPDGIESAQAAALAVHYCHHRIGATAQLPAWVQDQLRAAGGRVDWTIPWQGPVDALGVHSVRAALTALAAATTLSGLLHACVDYTGDVDTVAAIALAAGACTVDLHHDLPTVLYQDLENGPYGRDHLITLDQQLLQPRQ
jgi:ADP-ribosyl-[dinitrogen reductase] hydrolase